MKIVFVSPAHFPSRSAESIHVVRMCDAFAGLGHDVTLVCPQYDDGTADAATLESYYGATHEFDVRKIPFVSLKGGRRFFGVAAAAHARWTGADVMYSRDLQSAFFASQTGTPVALEVHTPLSKAGRLSRWMARRLFGSRRLVRVVAISEALVTHYGETWGIAPERLLLAREAAEDAGSGDDAESAAAEDGLRVGYIGHLYPGKGMEIVVELARACPWARFDVVGGEDADIEYWQNEAGDLDNLVFHGFVPHARTTRFRTAADVLLAPYQESVGDSAGGDIASWMSPMKVFEYMSAGKAIVASDLPVLREILREGETAIFSSPGRVEEWEEALNRLRREPDLRRRLGRNARSEFLDNYTWTRRAEKVTRALQPARS